MRFLKRVAVSLRNILFLHLCRVFTGLSMAFRVPFSLFVRFHKAVNWRSRLKTETTEHISLCRFREDAHSAVDDDIIFTDLSKDTTLLSDNHFQRLIHALSTSRRSKTAMTTSQHVSRRGL